MFVHSNSFFSDQSSTGAAGGDFVGSAVGTDTSTLCVDMGANTFHGDTTYFGVLVQNLGAAASGVKLVGMSGAFNDNTAAIANYVGSSGATTPPGVNTSVTPAPFVNLTGGHITGVVNCGVSFPP